MEPRSPEFIDHGPAVEHDQACCVHHSGRRTAPAILDCHTGIFHPSWRAQEEGWRLVRAKSWFHRWLLNTFFEKL